MLDSIGKDWLSSGSNLRDAITGLFGGLGSNKGRYYSYAHWKGDGLADTGIGYLANDKAEDNDRLAHQLAGIGGYGNSTDNRFNLGSSLSNIFGYINNGNAMNSYENNPFTKTLTDNILTYESGGGLPNYGTTVGDYLNLDNYGSDLSI